MNAYSRGLDLISNNVANLNTPGFKVSDPLFREIVYRHLDASGQGGQGGLPGGAGVEVGETGMSFRQGELRDTGNTLDAAIDGNGFFVLDRDGDQRYTRAGQFQFDEDGILIERATRAKVVLATKDQSLRLLRSQRGPQLSAEGDRRSHDHRHARARRQRPARTSCRT